MCLTTTWCRRLSPSRTWPGRVDRFAARAKGLDLEVLEDDIGSVAGASVLHDGHGERVKHVVGRSPRNGGRRDLRREADVGELLQIGVDRIVGKLCLEMGCRPVLRDGQRGLGPAARSAQMTTARMPSTE